MREDYKEIYKKTFETNNLEKYLQEEIIDKLGQVQDAVTEKNKHMNLTAIKSYEDFVLSHWVDAFKAVDHIKDNSTVLDVGTGGGIIGFACALSKKNLNVVCLDSTSKKIEFIKETCAALNINNISAISARAEDYIKIKRERFDVAIARAVANMPVLTELCLPYVKNEGVFIAMKGKNGPLELENAKNAIDILGGQLEKDDEFDLIDNEGTLLKRHVYVIRKVKKTPLLYPRAYGAIIKKPL